MQIDRSCGFNAPPYLTDFSTDYSHENRCRNPSKHALIMEDNSIRFLCDKHNSHYLTLDVGCKKWVCPKSIKNDNILPTSMNSYKVINPERVAASKR